MPAAIQIKWTESSNSSSNSSSLLQVWSHPDSTLQSECHIPLPRSAQATDRKKGMSMCSASEREVATYSHVGIGADEGLGEGSEKLNTHTKVTQLHLTMRVEEDVGRLDI